MGERLLCKQEVIGSIPFTSTSFRRPARAAHRRRLAMPKRNLEPRSQADAVPEGSRATAGPDDPDV